MDRIIVVEDFQHADGMYRVRYMNHPQLAKEGKRPPVTADVFVRYQNDRNAFHLFSWLLEPNELNIYEKAVRVVENKCPMPLTITEAELQAHYNSAMDAFAEKFAQAIAKEELEKLGEEEPASENSTLGAIFIIAASISLLYNMLSKL